MRHDVVAVTEHAVHGIDPEHLGVDTVEEEDVTGHGIECRVLGVVAAVRQGVDEGHDVVTRPEPAIGTGAHEMDTPQAVVGDQQRVARCDVPEAVRFLRHRRIRRAGISHGSRPRDLPQVDAVVPRARHFLDLGVADPEPIGRGDVRDTGRVRAPRTECGCIDRLHERPGIDGNVERGHRRQRHLRDAAEPRLVAGIGDEQTLRPGRVGRVGARRERHRPRIAQIDAVQAVRLRNASRPVESDEEPVGTPHIDESIRRIERDPLEVLPRERGGREPLAASGVLGHLRHGDERRTACVEHEPRPGCRVECRARRILKPEIADVLALHGRTRGGDRRTRRDDELVPHHRGEQIRRGVERQRRRVGDCGQFELALRVLVPIETQDLSARARCFGDEELVALRDVGHPSRARHAELVRPRRAHLAGLAHDAGRRRRLDRVRSRNEAAEHYGDTTDKRQPTCTRTAQHPYHPSAPRSRSVHLSGRDDTETRPAADHADGAVLLLPMAYAAGLP